MLIFFNKKGKLKKTIKLNFQREKESKRGKKSKAPCANYNGKKLLLLLN
jgi:hypothetical protein